MVVLILEKVSASLRGELSRWMIEPRTGVFVGQISAMVRDRLWEMAVQGVGKRTTSRSGVGGAMLLWSSPTEQGFQVRVFGDTNRDLLDWEGLSLVHVPTALASSKPGAKKRGSGGPERHQEKSESDMLVVEERSQAGSKGIEAPVTELKTVPQQSQAD